MQKSRFSIYKISSIKMNAIKMNTIRIGMAVGVCFLLALAAGCSSDADQPPYPDGSNGDAGMNQPSENEDEITTVPFTITLGGLSGSDGNAKQDGRNTRVAPPGAGSSSSSGTIGEDYGYAETDKVNAVRLIAFRRRVQNKGENTATYDAAVNDIQGFEYDPTNDKVITGKPTVEDVNEDDYLSGKPHKHYVVKGKFGISRGYEYRIIALAYNSQEKSPYPQYEENNVVTTEMLNLKKGTTFQEFKATFASYLVNDDGKTDTPNNWLDYLKKIVLTLNNVDCLSRQLITVPQLFYGTLYQQGDDTQNPIISSADYQKENLGNNTPTPLVGTLYRGMAEVEVHITHAAHYSITAQTQWYCLLADTVLTQMPLTSYDGFKQGGEPINNYSKKGGTYTAIAYAQFPGEGKEVVLKAFVLPGKTHLAVRIGLKAYPHAHNYQIKAKDMMSSEAATCVIVVDGVSNLFYLRRNHKYVFTYDEQKTLTDSRHLLE
ncbi:hypothetical protein [Segatella copri]|uniref:Uncharacterized protein n=1 Tax=Segatella copri TaxID=165179 RepID=A0AAW5IB83_9BACT|nr:hypothetical protein [Segatella copri]MCP9546770.1 hypothetical protein [Segatella copri]MCP9550154.1 hypothetical protein [Segatella copri]MCP9556417.1 hypothetical protein [Segatella copri]MCP9571056.1 hypothetical protein [Segatella copri]